VRRHLAAALGIALVGAAALGCARATRVEFDPGEDFARYRSWDWLPAGFAAPTRERRLGAELESALRAAVERELAARGFVRTSDGAPDFYVSYHADLSIQLGLGIDTPAMQTLSNFNQAGAYEIGASRSQPLRRYDEGTLAVDVADGRERQLVWRGLQTGRWRNGIRGAIDEAVAEIFEGFPPEPEKARAGDDA
jgi:hypothetical protein